VWSGVLTYKFTVGKHFGPKIKLAKQCLNYLASEVPRTGFEPAHPCERCDLNTVRLPISPSGHPVSLLGSANVSAFLNIPNFLFRKGGIIFL
jgi:hypothetical protein